MERVAPFKGKGDKKREGENVSVVQCRGRKKTNEKMAKSLSSKTSSTHIKGQ